MADVLNYLKETKNTLIGNPTAKLELQRTREPEGPLLPSIVSYVNLHAGQDAASDSSCSEETAIRIRVEAANVIASLAHGPREVLHGLLEANAVSAVLTALADLSPLDPDSLRVAIARALRSLCVAIAECTGSSTWGIGAECTESWSEARQVLDYIFQPEALEIILPCLEGSTQVKLAIAQLLAFAVRAPKHRNAVTEWLPPEDRVKETKGKRGWENTALVNANSPSRQGGWAVRHLSEMLKSKQNATQEAALYAISSLVKDNRDIALILSKPPPENKAPSVLATVFDFTRDRRTEVRLAACLCATNILRAGNSNQSRHMGSAVLHILSAIISDGYQAPRNRMKACHILSHLVIDDNDRCVDAWKSGILSRLVELVKTITPLEVPQEWEDGEPIDVAELREATFVAIGSIALHDNDIRSALTGPDYGQPPGCTLLPLISVSLRHPQAGVRYGACHCIRALARSVRVLRTSLLDSGVGIVLCEIVENKDEDRRVTNLALAGLCNLVNDFSPLRKTILERSYTSKRIVELSKSSDTELRINALCAVRNLLYKTNSEEKKSIMNEVGWGYLKECMADPNERVQEQALNILENIASTTETHVDMVFQHFSGAELINILAEALDSPSEDVQAKAVRVLANIANGRTTHRAHVLSSMRILSALRLCMTHARPEIRQAAVSCIEQLARDRPYQLREAGIDDTLRHISRDSSSVGGLSGALSASPGRVGGIMGVESNRDVRESARNALRHFDMLMEDYDESR